MVLPVSDDRTQHGEEGEPRDAQPVGPVAPGARLVDQGLADVEDDRAIATDLLWRTPGYADDRLSR